MLLRRAPENKHSAVEELFPDMVSTDKNGYKRVDYGRLPFLLLAGVRELKARNDSLSRQIEHMQKAQQARIDELTRQLQEVQAALKAGARPESRVAVVALGH